MTRAAAGAAERSPPSTGAPVARSPAGPVRPQDNPFAACRIDSLAWRPPPEIGGPSRRELLSRLAAMGGAGALVGPEGHGKTTLLDELGELARRRSPWPRLRRLTVRREGGRRGRPPRLPRGELSRFLAGVGPGDLLLVDGADHLPAWSRWRLRRAGHRAAGLLITSHRHGVLPTLLDCESSPGLLADLVAELLGAAPPPVPLPSAADLHRRHAGNLRDALHELYDRCAGRWRAAS